MVFNIIVKAVKRSFTTTQEIVFLKNKRNIDPIIVNQSLKIKRFIITKTGNRRMKKYILKPRNELHQIKDMMVDAGLDPEPVLTDWLMNYRGKIFPMMPLPLEDHLNLFKEMFSHSAHNLNVCLNDWRRNYRVKKEKLNLRQTRLMRKINPELSPKAFGIGIRDCRCAI